MSGGGLTPTQLEADLADAATTFDVVRSTPTTLLVDLDTPSALEQFERVLPRVRELYLVEKVEQWKSKSGHDHAVVTMGMAMPVYVRVALQAALGSDGIREVLALERAHNGCDEPSALFRPRKETP